MARVKWVAEDRFRIGRVEFSLSEDEDLELGGGSFVVVKTRAMVERYVELLAELRPTRIVELGIHRGGGTALLSLLAKPEKLVALDIRAEAPAALEEFISQNQLQGRLRTHCSVDQADGERLRAIVREEFGDDPLDLVVDDASHKLDPTRASFDVLFPRLRPGGVFVIEDWSVGHRLDAGLHARLEADPEFRARFEREIFSREAPETPPSVLLFELVLAAAYAPGVIAEVGAWEGWAHVVRGPAALDPDSFSLSEISPESAAALIGGRD